jgi:HAD superfamily phosphoserine phosphatase-like hydrolase
MESTVVKYSYFDFCHTVVKEFTLSNFVSFVEKNEKLYFTMIKNKLFKRDVEARFLHLWKYKNRETISLANAYAKTLVDKLNEEVLSSMKSDIDEGFKIVLVSAGLELYIKPFFELLGISIMHYITSFVEDSGDDSPIFVSMYAEKKLESIKELELKLAPSMTKGYSDHISDLPMLLHVDVPIVITGPNSKLVAVANRNSWKII